VARQVQCALPALAGVSAAALQLPRGFQFHAFGSILYLGREGAFPVLPAALPSAASVDALKGLADAADEQQLLITTNSSNDGGFSASQRVGEGNRADSPGLGAVGNSSSDVATTAAVTTTASAAAESASSDMLPAAASEATMRPLAPQDVSPAPTGSMPAGFGRFTARAAAATSGAAQSLLQALPRHPFSHHSMRFYRQRAAWLVWASVGQHAAPKALRERLSSRNAVTSSSASMSVLSAASVASIDGDPVDMNLVGAGQGEAVSVHSALPVREDLVPPMQVALAAARPPVAAAWSAAITAAQLPPLPLPQQQSSVELRVLVCAFSAHGQPQPCACLLIFNHHLTFFTLHFDVWNMVAEMLFSTCCISSLLSDRRLMAVGCITVAW
jgi:hypothetical protein